MTHWAAVNTVRAGNHSAAGRVLHVDHEASRALPTHAVSLSFFFFFNFLKKYVKKDVKKKKPIGNKVCR